MEDLLLNIVKECGSTTKLNALKQSAQLAHDKLFRQHGIHRDPSFELRAICLQPLQTALETRRPKFTTFALNGIHRVIRDERFYVGLEPEDDSLWLPAQLLRTTNGLTTVGSGVSEDTIVNILRLFLAMACSPTCTLNGRLLIEILSRCGECWENGTRAIRAASLAAASQCLRTFSHFLKDEVEEVMKTLPDGFTNIAQATAVYNEVIPVIQWLCSRLIEPKNTGSPAKNETNGSLYLTECILTLTTALPKDVQSNPHFTAFLWQKFCPTLAAALGSPGRVNIDKKFTYKDALHIIESESRGFFTSPGLDGPQARCIYLTSNQMLRIAGAHGSLRPMLEALFHRILLLPTPQNRAEPLRCVREIFKNPERLVDLSVILYPDKTQGQSCSDDMALFRLIIDAIEECATAVQSGSSCENSFQCSVECIVELLNSLQYLCTGEIDYTIFSDQVTHAVNLRYANLRDVDYTGPLTYQSMARLPAPYRDAVAQLRQNGFESTSGSDSDIEHNEQQEVGSNGSGDTEGPEDENNSSSDEISSKTDGVGVTTGNWLWPNIETQALLRTDGDCDRQHAREFAKSITNDLVAKLLKLRTSVEVDECMQEFASSICQQNSLNFSDLDYNLTAINADGIYLATYSALLLSHQLMKAGHYEDTEGDILIPLSEQQFVTSVQNAGVLVYLSSAWLSELYQSVLAVNPLATMAGEEQNGAHCSLIDMLSDAGGLGNSQMLSEWQRLQSVAKKQAEPTERELAAKKLARRLLTCCWESMVTVLGVGLGEIEVSKTNKIVALSKKTLRVKRGQKVSGEALYALSLEGLHSAATLSNSLNLQHLAGKILNLIASNVCRTTGPRISASQALSMDVVLSGGLALGSHSAECWMPVFQVCRHVSQLEYELFSCQNANVSSVTSNGLSTRETESLEKNTFSAGTGSDKLNLTSTPIDDDEMCIDVYSFLQAPLQNPNVNVTSIIKPYGSTESTLLTQGDTAKVFCALSHQTENLFCDASERLSLPALCQFLKSLCRASRDQLYRNSSNKGNKKSWWPGRAWKQRTDSHPLSLLLHRVGDVTLRVFRGPRPLLHILKIWAITGPHLMDAACHRDRSISKRAIEYIHDVITAVLVEQSELAHFHFNEALLKPFENLLSMETCDIDVQDQIVACLYEIVEAHRTEIRSGWRPLFGTLRNARNRPLHISNVTDIFRVFLDSDNTLVFANAGLDCILCLLSYLEISGNPNNVNGIDDIETRPSEFLHDTLKFLERCSSILAFMYNMPKCPNLHSTYKIKGMSYTHIIDANIPNSMENFTYFGNEHLQNINEQHMISYRSLHIDKEIITKLEELDKPSGVLKVWFLLLDGLTNSLIVCPTSHQSPILHTIFKLFRSLINNPGIDFGFYCINHLLIPMIQDWLRYVNKTQKNWLLIEKNFKHCCGMTTDLVVEFIEKSNKNFQDGGDQPTKQNGNVKLKFTKIQRPVDNLRFHHLKHLTKMDSASSGSSDDHPGLDGSSENNSGSNSNSNTSPVSSPTKIPTAGTLALKQLLLVLIECTAQAQESVARVGVSCLKHVILSTGHIFNEEQWMVACSAIHRACSVTIAPLRQLSFAFYEKSNSFYGDCATVKVTARRDSTIEELNRIHSLAQQVFLMDNQRDLNTSSSTSSSSISSNSSRISTNSSSSNIAGIISNSVEASKLPLDDRSYSFLLYPMNCFGQNIDSFVIRIPYRNLIVGLLANQMLLQLVANLLLCHLKSIPTSIHACIYNNYQTNTVLSKSNFEFGFRPKEILVRCLRQYITSSIEFDSRPGLKFLIQKVSNIEFAANLYKQLTSSWMVYYLCLVDSYLNDIKSYNLSFDDLKYILESCSKVNLHTVKKKENFIRYLFFLQEAIGQICEMYLNSCNIEYNSSTTNTPEKETIAAVQNGDGVETDERNNNNNNNNLDADNTQDSPVVDDEKADSEKEKDVTTINPQDDESISVTLIIAQQQNGEFITTPTRRTNPFDTNRNVVTSPQKHNQDAMHEQSISPEIEQQRSTSISKDMLCRKMALNQLVIASMELLHSLPDDAEENLKLLITPTIREAYRQVKLQGTELKTN